LRYAYASHLTANGFQVEEAADLTAAHKSFMATRPDVAVLDFRLPDGNALDLLSKFKELEPNVPIIILTGFGSMELGVALIRAGAEQCLAKPVEASALLMIVHKLLENSRNQQKTLANNTRRRRVVLNPFFGESPAIPTPGRGGCQSREQPKPSSDSRRDRVRKGGFGNLASRKRTPLRGIFRRPELCRPHTRIPGVGVVWSRERRIYGRRECQARPA
jgi:Response regulator containing CheY-like receiver, AAA-type ATPase, and DNA-binding domains